MSASITVTETAALTILGTLLLNILPGALATPPTCEVIRAQVNRTPEPTASDFVAMTPLLRERLATNIDSYQDDVTAGFRYALQATQYTVQLDFHGPNAGDNVQIFMTLWRDGFSTEFFSETVVIAGTLDVSFGVALTDQNGNAIQVTSIVDAQPLYCSEPRQLAFVNGEQQYENRWTVDAVMQVNPVISTSQQFAAQLAANIIDVDVAYPV